MCFGFCEFFFDSQAHLAVTNAFQVQESQPKVLFTDLPPLWFLPVKEADKAKLKTEMERRIQKWTEG